MQHAPMLQVFINAVAQLDFHDMEQIVKVGY